MIKIVEFAKNKRVIELNLMSKSDEIINHLLKYYYWHDSEYAKHWCIEIHAGCSKVYKMKSNNKYPSPDFLYNCLYGDSEDIMDNIIELFWDMAKDEYPDYKVYEPVFTDKLKTFMREYFWWLSSRLSQNGSVKQSEVIQELSLLYNDYKP